MVQASGQDASWMSPWGGIVGMPIQEETRGLTKDTLERLYFLPVLGTFWCPPGGVGGSDWGEKHLDLPAEAVAPATRTQISSRKQDETKRVTQVVDMQINEV